MDKKVKYYLKNIIKESLSTDVDEMARRQKDMRDLYGDPKRKISEFMPVWSKDNPTNPGEEGTPDGWIINPEKKEGEDRLIILYYDCTELDSLMEEIKPMLDEFEEKYGLEPELVPCKSKAGETGLKKTIDKPRISNLGTSYKKTNEESKTRRIRRISYEIIRQILSNDYVNNELQKRSIPPIIIKRAHLDTHIDEPTNEEIIIRSHTYNSYENLEAFFESAISVLEGGDPNGMITHYLARGFNKVYKNWFRAKKQIKDYVGKTRVYKLDKLGLELKNLDASILMDFKINGIKENDSFKWYSEIKTSISKKKSETSFPSGTFVEMFSKSYTTTVQIDPDVVFDDRYTVMNDESISNGLKECLKGLREQILSIDPEEVLNFATLDVYMLGDKMNDVEGINENKKINSLINSVIREIRNKPR